MTQPKRIQTPAYVKHARLTDWVAEVAALTEPDNIVWCDGSQEGADSLFARMVASGTMIKLNPAKQTTPGRVPRFEDPDRGGSEEVTRAQFEHPTAVNTAAWREELKLHAEWFDKLKSRMPRSLTLKRERLELALVD